MGLDHVGEDNVGETLFLVAGEQARENGIAVEAGKAPPENARLGIDQRRGAAVADDGEIEAVILHAPIIHSEASDANHARTSAARAKANCAPAIVRPTEIP